MNKHSYTQVEYILYFQCWVKMDGSTGRNLKMIEINVNSIRKLGRRYELLNFITV